jgi:hypothetical protein
MSLSSRPGLGQTASRPRRCPAAAQRGTTWLRLEQLEDRTLPSFGFGWAFHVGGTTGGLEAGRGIATDGQGNVYVSGSFSGTNVNFDPLNSSPLPSAYLSGSDTTFAAKYSSNGLLQWVTPLQALSGWFLASDIAVQGSNVYVTGGAGGPADAVAKLDAASGTVAWTVSLPVSGSSSFMGVAVGQSTGNVYVTSSTGSSQAFVAQVDATGVIQWIKTTSGGSAAGNRVAVYDAPNNGPESVYLTGSYTGTTTFGTTTKTSLSGSQAIFVWELNADGTTAAATSLGTKMNSGGNGIAVDGAGFVYLTGNWSSAQILVAKLTPTLATSWTKFISGRGNDSGSGGAVAVDSAGHVYTTGSFYGTFDFDPGPGTYTLQSGQKGNDLDGYVSELDANGNFVAVADFHALSAAWNGGEGIAVDNTSPGSPNVYTTGYFHGTMDFDSTAGTYSLTANSSGRDAFVSKLTQPANPLRATRGDVSLAANTSADQALALFIQGSLTTIGSSAADVDSRGQTAGPRVAQDVLGTASTGLPSAETPPALLPRSPSTGTLDRLFADLWVDTLVADTRWSLLA